MKRFSYIVCFILLLASSTFAQTTRPIAGVNRVMIVSIDGCRPDLLLRAKTPTIHAMLDRGTFSLWARTTAESITLPSHVSMLTGVIPTRHSILWNSDIPLAKPVYPAFPTLFQLAKSAGYSTAIIAGKTKFSALEAPASLDWSDVPTDQNRNDVQVTDAAVSIINAHQPQVLFVHLPFVDTVGHARGWASPERMEALATADQCVGRLIKALDDNHLTDSTLVIVTADHGGQGRVHGPEDARSRHIPWIVTGPGVRHGVDLTRYADLIIDTEDTFSTACWALNIPVQRKVDGKPIKEIQEVDQAAGK